jgi:replication initiation and membrane attachment protein
VFWEEIQFRSRHEKALDATDLYSLTHLYQPIVGVIGVGLYVTLHAQATKTDTAALLTHTYLFKLLAISHNQLLEARYQLEGVGLLRTFEKTDVTEGNYLEYQVVSPLSPLTFFQTMPLAVQLQQRLGKEAYQSLKQRLCAEEMSENSINLTKSFKEVYGKTPVVQPEKKTKTIKAEIDFAFIKSRLASVIKPENWSAQLESELTQACYLFQLDESALIKALQNPAVSYGGRVNLEKLFHHLNTAPAAATKPAEQSLVTEPVKKITVDPSLSAKERHFQLLEQISPFELLAHYQGGAAIPKSEMELIQSLLTHYQLPAPVVNVLLDYVLLKCDRKLPKAYVEKIASHWKRLNIQTSEQARKQALKEYKKQPSQPSSTQQTTNVTKARRKQAVKKLPKTIAREVIAPTFTEEELRGTYEDIEATMQFLRSTEKKVLHNKD